MLMTPLVHLIAGIISGYIVAPRGKKYGVLVWVTAIACLGVDLDHLFLTGAFHNIWLLFSLPLLAFGVAYLYESTMRPWTVTLRTISMLVFVNNTGHLLLDTIDTSPLLLFYPFSTQEYVISDSLAVSFGRLGAMTSAQTLVVIYALMLILLRVGSSLSVKRMMNSKRWAAGTAATPDALAV